MKNLYLTFLSFAFVIASASAQNDTLLWENFEAETIDYIQIDYPTGDPNLYPTWLNFDVDGQGDGSGSDRPGEWFLTLGFADVDSTNTVLASNSWLQGEVNGAENWLISPQIFIQDGLASLYWKSAPYQLPRYLDGYQVLVSTTDNLETSFMDTLAVFSEFDGDLTTDKEDTSTYVFSPGIMHTDMEADATDFTRNRGVLQQWQASLADFEGQSIFIAFRHRSDDDNLISIDDILVLGTGSVGIDELSEINTMEVYPNPISSGNSLTIEYSLAQTSPVSYSIMTIDGQLVVSQTGHIQMAGLQRTTIDMSGIAPGTYLVTVMAGEHSVTEKVVISE